MNSRLARGLLAASATVLLLGSLTHASAYPKVRAAVSTSQLEPFFAGSFKLLWLGDSIVLATLAAAFALVAARPGAACRPLVALLAFIPAATAALLYRFIGNFPPAHLLLAAAIAAVVASATPPKASA